MSFAGDNRHLDTELNIIYVSQIEKLFIFLAIQLMRTNQYQTGFNKCKYSLKTSNQNRKKFVYSDKEQETLTAGAWHQCLNRLRHQSLSLTT